MKTPLFSVALIAKNESKTLPRLIASLAEFKERGGEIILADTGSTDGTPKVAADLGCIVFEEGERFIHVLDAEIARGINDKFVVGGEQPIVKEGDRLFDFSAARNSVVSLASRDWVCILDCDEAFTKLDLDAVDSVMSMPNLGRIEHDFVYAHDSFGDPIIQFRHARFYNRLKSKWNSECIVHEVLTDITPSESIYLGPEVVKIEHWQNLTTNRSGYLVGLALDCFLHPKNDRNSHYFGRELMYKGRYQSAIRELKRHITMNGWAAERAQSMVFIGDCYKSLNQPEEALDWWNRAFLADGHRREPLMRLACYFFEKNDHHKTAAYASAALALPNTDFYANDENHYRQQPHELLYWALWWMGDRAGSGFHWRQAVSYQPFNEKYLSDGQFYLKPGLSLDEFKKAVIAREPFSFVKLGDGERACIDGVKGENCDGHTYSPELARALIQAFAYLSGSVHVVGFRNQKTFNMLLHRTDNNLLEVKSFWDAVSARTGVKVFVGPSRLRQAAELLKARFVEVPLKNAFSDFERVKKELFNYCKRDALFVFSTGMMSKILIAELLKVRSDITCIDAGSAFDPLFVGETRTVQAPREVLERLYFGKSSQPHVTVCIPTLGREEKLKNMLDLLHKTAEYSNYDVVVEHDSFTNRAGVPKLLKKMVDSSKGELVAFLGNDCIPKPGWLRLAVEAMQKNFPDLDGFVSFNDEYSCGKENPHWLASKKLLPMLGGEFFHTGYHHVGCDNELSARCKKAGKYVWCEEAKVFHDHYSLNSRPGNVLKDFDETARLAWQEDLVEADRALLKSRAAELNFQLD
jgi:glycosyltransferase involved in cell wall biosynthesis